MLVKIFRVYLSGGKSKVPQIRIQGKWLQRWGFTVGKEYSVEMRRNELILRPVTLQDGKYIHEVNN